MPRKLYTNVDDLFNDLDNEALLDDGTDPLEDDDLERLYQPGPPATPPPPPKKPPRKVTKPKPKKRK